MVSAPLPRQSEQIIASLVKHILIAALCLYALASVAAAPTRPLRPEIAEFIDEMAAQHQYDRALLQRAFSEVRPRPGILRAMAAPGTARPWHVFRARYIDDVRIAAGVSFWRQHAAVLARAAFFRGELEQFLLLARDARFDLMRVRGSYAGAIGIPQFLPSSYRKYAVDYDRDGRVDLIGSPSDAVGSVANYYRAFGWETGGTVAVRATSGEGTLEAIAAADNIKPHILIAELKRRGVVPKGAVSDEAQATVFALETESGTQYWLGLQNFYVITRYNRSVNYAMVVHELARELRDAMRREAGATGSPPGGRPAP